MAAKRALNGFSLPELVTLIVILGVLAAVALPKLNQQATDEGYFAEQVKSAVRYAQKQAVAQRRTVYVLVSSADVQLCYTVSAPTPPHTCTSTLRDVLTGNPYILTTPSGVTLSSAPSTISFNGLGQPSAAATVTVGGKTIAVQAETGYTCTKKPSEPLLCP